MQSGIPIIEISKEQGTTPSEHSIVINDADNLTPDEEDIQDGSICLVHAASSPFPTFFAVIQTIQTTIDMKKDAKILMYAITPISFLSSFGLNKKYTFDGVDSIWQIASTKKLPSDWPKVSPKKKIFGLAVSGVVTAYVIFSDSFQYYDLARQFPKEYPLLLNISTEDFEPYAWAIGIVSSVCISSLSEALPLAQYIQECLADKPAENPTGTTAQQPPQILFLKRWITPNISRVVSMADGINDALSTLMPMKAILGVHKSPYICILGTATLCNYISDYALYRSYVNSSLNDLIDYLATKTPTKKDIFYFSTSLASAILYAYLWQGLTEDFLMEVINEFSINTPYITNPFTYAISYGSAINYLISTTAALIPIYSGKGEILTSAASYAFTATVHGFQKLGNTLYSCASNCLQYTGETIYSPPNQVVLSAQSTEENNPFLTDYDQGAENSDDANDDLGAENTSLNANNQEISKPISTYANHPNLWLNETKINSAKPAIEKKAERKYSCTIL